MTHKLKLALLLAAAALLHGCGEEGSGAVSAEAAQPAAEAEAAALGSRARDAAARLSAMAADDPARAEAEAELEGLRNEIKKVNEASRKRNLDATRRRILEQRRGGAK